MFAMLILAAAVAIVVTVPSIVRLHRMITAR